MSQAHRVRTSVKTVPRQLSVIYDIIGSVIACPQCARLATSGNITNKRSVRNVNGDVSLPAYAQRMAQS